jgi:hypothetical protein
LIEVPNDRFGNDSDSEVVRLGTDPRDPETIFLFVFLLLDRHGI